MKIIYCTDIHDGLKELRLLLLNTEADLYILSGDILYKAFYDEDKIYNFVCLQEEFNTLSNRSRIKKYPFDLAQDILRFPDKYDRNEELLIKAAEYRGLFNQAKKTMKEKYELVEDLIVKYGNAECWLLPGNYDINLRYTALAHRDLHHRIMNLNGLSFAGYGGAPIATSGIPEKLSVVFHERREEGRLYSEPWIFFSEIEPDVLVTHNPPYGYFDHVSGLGHIGSPGIRDYLDEHSPRLVLSGHVHEDYGIALKNKTLLLNPSNFGGVDSSLGFQEGGAFAELYVSNNDIRTVVINRLVEDRIYELLKIEYDGEKLQKTVNENAVIHSHLDHTKFIRDSYGVPVN